MCFHPQIPLENKSIFSGSLFQYLEENKKWRSRFLFVPDSYNINYYDSKAVRGKQKLFFCSVFRCCWFDSLFNMLTLLPVLTTSPMKNTSIPKEPSTVPATKCWHLLSNTWTWSATACLVRRRRRKWRRVKGAEFKLQQCMLIILYRNTCNAFFHNI